MGTTTRKLPRASTSPAECEAAQRDLVDRHEPACPEKRVPLAPAQTSTINLILVWAALISPPPIQLVNEALQQVATHAA